MRIWIDATRDVAPRVFGMSTLERLLRDVAVAQRRARALRAVGDRFGALGNTAATLRALVDRRLVASEIRIELPEGAEAPALPADLAEVLPIVFCTEPGTRCERLARAADAADGEPTLVVATDAIVDLRLVEHLLSSDTPLAFFTRSSADAPVVFRLDAPIPADLAGRCREAELVTLARACVDAGAVRAFSPDDFEAYIPKLRRTQPAWLLPVATPADAERAEHFLFQSNYKGATDFLTKYVYPPAVWRLVKSLSERGVKPNTVTAVGIVCCFLAVPFFAVGWWLPGLCFAYAMSVLDSVDGKLARVTLTSSTLGDVLDHGTDYVHPPIWYCAWALGLSGDPHSALFHASLWLAALYVADRLLEQLFKLRTGGRSVQDYTPLDARLRTFVSRRNVNLALFTVALPLGLGVEAFHAVVWLQGATAAYHATRLIQFWNAGDAPPRTRASTDERTAELHVGWSRQGVTES